MNIEYEATFEEIDIVKIQDKLKSLGGTCIKPRTLYKRSVFNIPGEHAAEHIWGRVRDEGDVITLTIKEFMGEGIEAQKEIELVIDDYATGVALLEKLGCIQKAYQETYREIWQVDGVHVMLDEWPFLEPFIEIEGKNEEVVKKLSERLGFDYSQAIFGGVSIQYAKKYGISLDQIDNQTPRITFDENPFK